MSDTESDYDSGGVFVSEITRLQVPFEAPSVERELLRGGSVMSSFVYAQEHYFVFGGVIPLSEKGDGVLFVVNADDIVERKEMLKNDEEKLDLEHAHRVIKIKTLQKSQCVRVCVDANGENLAWIGNAGFALFKIEELVINENATEAFFEEKTSGIKSYFSWSGSKSSTFGYVSNGMMHIGQVVGKKCTMRKVPQSSCKGFCWQENLLWVLTELDSKKLVFTKYLCEASDFKACEKLAFDKFSRDIPCEEVSCLEFKEEHSLLCIYFQSRGFLIDVVSSKFYDNMQEIPCQKDSKLWISWKENSLSNLLISKNAEIGALRIEESRVEYCENLKDVVSLYDINEGEEYIPIGFASVSGPDDHDVVVVSGFTHFEDPATSNFSLHLLLLFLDLNEENSTTWNSCSAKPCVVSEVILPNSVVSKDEKKDRTAIDQKSKPLSKYNMERLSNSSSLAGEFLSLTMKNDYKDNEVLHHQSEEKRENIPYRQEEVSDAKSGLESFLAGDDEEERMRLAFSKLRVLKGKVSPKLQDFSMMRNSFAKSNILHHISNPHLTLFCILVKQTLDKCEELSFLAADLSEHDSIPQKSTFLLNLKNLFSVPFIFSPSNLIFPYRISARCLRRSRKDLKIGTTREVFNLIN